MHEPACAKLVCATNFTFLHEASYPFELVETAAAFGLAGLGICDRNSCAGVVPAHVAARDLKERYPNFRLVVGTRLYVKFPMEMALLFNEHRPAVDETIRVLSLTISRSISSNTSTPKRPLATARPRSKPLSG